MAEVEVQNQNGSENGSGNGAKAVAFSTFKPQLVVDATKAADAVQFYKSAFGAEEVARATHPKRKIDQELPLLLSADLNLASTIFSVSGSDNDSAVKTGTGCVFSLETEDVEAAIAKAVSAGAVAEGEVVEGEGACFAGRMGKVTDPYGFVWMICSAAKACDANEEAYLPAEPRVLL